jgi:hypothetical protein
VESNPHVFWVPVLYADETRDAKNSAAHATTARNERRKA